MLCEGWELRVLISDSLAEGMKTSAEGLGLWK